MSDDLLTILASNDYYNKNEELIIDDIFTMFLAGSKTVQSTTTNLLLHLEHYPQVKEKLLGEIDSLLEPIKGDLKSNFDIEVAEQFEYLRLCFLETLRIDPPVPESIYGAFTETVVLNGVTVPKGDKILIAMDYIQNDPKHWQQPTKFIPERFDSSSEFYLAPNGKPRHPYAFSPFLGGQRICLGKSFAEKITVFTLSLLLWHYDFKLVDKKFSENKPKINVMGNQIPTIKMRKVVRNELI